MLNESYPKIGKLKPQSKNLLSSILSIAPKIKPGDTISRDTEKGIVC